MLSQRLNQFPPQLFQRGRPYLSRLKHVSSSGKTQQFLVRGTWEYDVLIEGQGEDLFASCTCPAFEEMDECKHVAACILYLDNTTFAQDFDGVVYYLGSDFGDWSSSAEQPSPLKRLVGMVQFQQRDSVGPVFPDEKKTETAIAELWYELLWNFYVHSYSEIEVRFHTRSSLKSGKLGKIKEQKLRLGDLDRIQNKEDSEILKSLIPFLEMSSDYHSAYFYSAALKKPQAGILEKILRTGRAFIQRRDRWGRVQDDIVPLEVEADALMEAKIVTDMEGQWLRLGYSIGNRPLTRKEEIEVQVKEDLGFALYKGRIYPFETFLSSDLLRMLASEGELKFTKEELTQFKEDLLARIDHRAIGGDRFGLEVRTVPSIVEVHIKLPLGTDKIQARMISPATPPNPPFEHLTVYSVENYREIKSALENVITGRIDAQGFFEIPIDQFQKTIAGALELNVPVKAEKAVIKTATGLNLSANFGLNWFELDGTLNSGEENYSLPEILKKMKDGDSFVEFKKGELTYLPQAWLDKVKKVSETAEYKDGKFVVHLSRAQQLESLEVPSLELERFLKQIKDFKSIKPVRPSKKFKGELRDYQLFGLCWMGFLRDMGLGGCLADDMGLGKTVQVAANLQLRKYEKNRVSIVSLVVCPRSLVFNWHNELTRFAPDLKVLLYEGGSLESVPSDCDVLITTYGLLQRHCEHFIKNDFDYVVLDEAQAIKNPRSLTSKAIFTLKAAHRLALTGTPVENHVGEFYSIFNFLMPGAYKKEAMNPDPKNHSLARALRPFVLRRTKQQVLNDLPDKVEQVIYCEPLAEERKHYDELKKFVQDRLNKKVDMDEFKKSSIVVLEALTRLRQAACHPGLINPEFGKLPSGKLEQLKIMLDEVLEEGHKVIIFSQFTSLLKLVRENLGFDGKNSVYLDGTSRDREGIVNDFRDSKEKNVFFLSIKAGGTGLNLVEASYCFLLDPWWNPAVEDQAIGRLHRIGQKKSVNVYRLITRGSIEEKVLQLQGLKKEVIQDVLDENSEGFIRSLTSKDLEFLLN